MIDASTAMDKPPTPPPIEDVNASQLACMSDHPKVDPKASDDALFGIYEYWVHQNTGNHMNDGIKEEGKWHDRWENILCFSTQRYDAPSSRFRIKFVLIISLELDSM